VKLSPDAGYTLLTSGFPSDFLLNDCARECGVIERYRDIDIRILMRTLAVDFAVGGESRSITDYRCAYNAATNQSLVASSFYNRFTENLQNPLSPNSGVFVDGHSPGGSVSGWHQYFQIGGSDILAQRALFTYDSMRSLLPLESEQGTGKGGKPKDFQCYEHGPMNGLTPRMRRKVLRARIDAYPVHSLSTSTTLPTNHGVHWYGCPRSLLPSSDLGRRHRQS